MAALGLDGDYGAYVPCLPGVTLAPVNLMSLFGLHRRRRGTIAGHLAAFDSIGFPSWSRISNEPVTR